ncbi:MAG: glycosyltransferase family 1 protein, partial [Symploca sp. SIO2E6]|nr:glycosyltransferase family 1 protein [Symploca sp. SIO2E6]
MKALLVGCTKDQIVAAQQEPFIYNQKLLRSQLDLKIQHVQVETFADISEVCKTNDSDVVFLLPDWRETAENAQKIIKTVREDNPNRKLIFVDPFAQTSSNYFHLLPYVDCLLKRQRMKDLSEYKQQFIGGSMFTDFVAKQSDFDLNGWSVASEVPEGYEDRIATGWNLGTARRFVKVLRPPVFWPKRPEVKDIDIFCRLALGSQQKKEWYCQYRIAAVEALKPLESDYKLATSARFNEEGLIPRRQYLRETKSSRIVFSPFGWGENCWRDFEAVCYDCLLVKPSMAHIDTQPNIFIEGET